MNSSKSLHFEDNKNLTSSFPKNVAHNSVTILDTINEDDADNVNENVDSKSGLNSSRNVLNMLGQFRNVKLSDRCSALKEIVCTPHGFSWSC